MEGEVAAAILRVLVQNLIDHSKNEISQIRGLNKEAENLARRLGTLQEFLNDAEMGTIPGRTVKSWLKNLEDVAFDADNVLDELNYHRLSKQIKPIKPMKEKVLSCFSSLSHIALPRNMALRIQKINKNLEAIQTEAATLGLVQRFRDVPTFVDPAFETDSFTIDPIFIGRDEVVSEIVEILTTSITTDERVISIIAIVGMGGLGKTTLTRKVFNHQKEENRFGSHIWVHVSPNFNPIILFKKILTELTSQKVEVEHKQDILKKLQEALKDKTYLLVLDDVWNEDHLKWQGFINSLSGVTSTKGCAIMVTTRNMKVASTVNPLHKEELKGLSDEDCWSIIKEKTFGKEDVPSEFDAIGKNIARRCQGVPLAANIVGGVLCNKSEKEWLSIEREWLSHGEGDNIIKILRLSFDNLSPPSLKKCFAYCSVFPKGRKIGKQKLIEYWMAEGFLQADHGSNDMEFVGETFINILLHNSLLQVSDRDGYGNVSDCVMHDLVHDLASSVSGSSRVRYMTYEKGSSPITKEVAKYLRTLLSVDNIYENMFSCFESLHVLTLGYKVKELPSSIRKLTHLRNLDISCTFIRYLPDWIGELHQLQTFSAAGRVLRELPSTLKYLINLRHLYISWTGIKYLPDWIGELHQLQTLDVETGELRELPSTLKYLINLRHLYINWFTELPVGIGRLTSLQTLQYFIVGEKNGCEIKELGSLNGLKGKLEISKLERVHNKEEAEKASLSNKSELWELCLTWISNREGETRNDENVLEGLQPHSGLKKLEIKGFSGKRFPFWTRKMVVENVPRGSWVPLNKLIEIRLSWCSECEEIPMLGQLPNLKSLWLEGLSNVKCINLSFYGLVNEETRIVFPALERLVLIGMRNLAEWEGVELGGASDVKVFPHLQYLGIENCNQLTSFPNHSSSCLQYLKIEDCNQLTSFPNHSSSCLQYLIIRRIGSYKALANISRTKLTLLTGLYVEGIDDLECLPDWLFYSNPNLSELVIQKCPNLRRLPDGLGSGTCLRSLVICECNALLYLPCEMVGSSLDKLHLEDLSSLENLPSLIDCLPKLPRLTKLTIIGVPQFMATCRVEIPPFSRLERLEIDVSKGGSMETVDGILQGCSSLRTLVLKGMEGWENLPESIQHLTALERLTFKNYGMEELPEWLGNLSSLGWLYIYNCKKLRRLPSMDAMRRLTLLQVLCIIGCRELRMEEENDAAADSQWPNISHIPSIEINGRYVGGRRRKQVCLMSGCL